ncbi:hypothetical protein D3C81_2164880 [compost metagenome]
MTWLKSLDRVPAATPVMIEPLSAEGTAVPVIENAKSAEPGPISLPRKVPRSSIAQLYMRTCMRGGADDPLANASA